MADSRIKLIGAAALAAALGVGVAVQLAGQEALPRPAAAVTPVLPEEPAAAHLTLENITLTAVPRSMREAGAKTAETSAAAPVPDCAVTAQADPQPGAMVRLSAVSYCRPGGRVTVHHQGMTITETLDGAGELQLDVPALADPAVFLVAPEAGRAAVASAQVAGLEAVDRVVLQWRGSAGFELHALEPGAAYGGPGHVWHGARSGAGVGEVIRLGDAARLAAHVAEIYSLPRSGDGGGAVALSVETETTALNCGHEVAAQALEVRQGRQRTRDLVLQIPACTERGGFLVLNNLFENLKIAAN